MDSSPRRVVINVGGVRFETYDATLLSFPGTKLATLAELSPDDVTNFDPQHNEFFFDRNPKVFGYILDYYRTKHLHCSDNTCKAVLMEELSFWELNPTDLSHCCWLKINNKSQVMEDFSSWEESQQSEQQQFPTQTGRIDYSWRGRWQPKVWTIFEMPYSSLASKCVAAVSLLFTIGVIIIFFEETKGHVAYVKHIVPSEIGSSHTFLQEMSSEHVYYLIYLELLCVFWFLFEFCTRFFFCPSRIEFLKRPLNWVDFLSLFPVFIELMAKGQMQRMDTLWKILGFMRAVYILKLFRLVMLVEGSLVLRVLSGTLRAITREILILLLVLTLETLLFATLAYYSEFLSTETYDHSDSLFGDIYNCCWWAIITLTTVGYGDVYPITTFGRIIASITAVSGVLTIVLPIPILMIKFQHYYFIALAKEKLKLKQHGQKP